MNIKPKPDVYPSPLSTTITLSLKFSAFLKNHFAFLPGFLSLSSTSIATRCSSAGVTCLKSLGVSVLALQSVRLLSLP